MLGPLTPQVIRPEPETDNSFLLEAVIQRFTDLACSNENKKKIETMVREALNRQKGGPPETHQPTDHGD